MKASSLLIASLTSLFALAGCEASVAIVGEKPLSCTTEYAPVCGADGKTYGNSCEAGNAGVSIAHAGECTRLCGGIGNLTCGAGEFCRLDGCGISGPTDQPGTCTAKPASCVDGDIVNVCGCDGKTYANECEALHAGVSVSYKSACESPPPPRPCGSETFATCGANEYCKVDACGTTGPTDAPGVCTTKPSGCVTTDVQQVCSCEGVTFANACTAAMAGKNVAKVGACGGTCGGIAGLTCAATEYCAYTLADQCGAADAQGVCTVRPTGCIVEPTDPAVCGCDNKTYANECLAEKAGVAISKRAACN